MCPVKARLAGKPWTALDDPDQFPTPKIDEKYRSSSRIEIPSYRRRHRALRQRAGGLYSVIWPWPGREAGQAFLSASLTPDGRLVVTRPDGRTDTIAVDGARNPPQNNSYEIPFVFLRASRLA